MSAPSIVEVANDQTLFGQHFRDRESWRPWWTAIKAIFGLEMTADELLLFEQCTGRTEAQTEQAKEVFAIVGRRGGKSRILALIASYLGAFIDWRPYLAPGERGFIVVVASDRRACRSIMGYIRAFLTQTPLLAALVVRDNAEELELSNGVTIEVATCSYRTIRGRTVIAALCDEAAFWSDDDGSNPASEVIASLRPAMATIPNSLLLVASSPYAKAGPLWNAFKRYYGKPGRILVWRAASLVMNRALSADVVAAAFEEDPASAAAEYGAEFRSDVDAYVSREVVEALVTPGCFERPPIAGTTYLATIDPSGGSADSMTLAIGHQETGDGGISIGVIDAIRERVPPFSPEDVVAEFCELLKTYRVRTVTGDRYGGEWPRERFRIHGVEYKLAERPASDLYRDCLPVLNGRRAQLIDHPRLISQLCSLERRTARSGRDSISHPPNGHDDVANVVAALLATLPSSKRATPNLAAWASIIDEFHCPDRFHRPGQFSNDSWS